MSDPTPEQAAANLTDRQKTQILDVTENGHATRFSDSSLYDEVCIFCGAVDGMPMLGIPNTLASKQCDFGLAVRDILKS